MLVRPVTDTYVIVLGLLGAAAAVVIPILVARWLEDHFPAVHQALKMVLIVSLVVLALGAVAHDYWLEMTPSAQKWTLIIGGTGVVLLAVAAAAVAVLLQGSLAILGHAWAILTNILAAVVVTLMFGAAHSRFEVIVIAALTLVYLAVVSSSTLLSRANLETSMRSGAQFARLARLLNDPDVAAYEAQLNDTQRDWTAANFRFYMNTMFQTIIWLIAIWKLMAVTIAA